NEAAMKTLLAIQAQIDAGEVKDVTEWTKNALARKHRFPGIGHRVYKTEDPRATHLRRMSKELCTAAGQPHWYAGSRTIEDGGRAAKGRTPTVAFSRASVS